MNYTIPSQAFNINNNSLFNPDCMMDLNKLASQCADFRVQVTQTLSHRFYWALGILTILILYKIMVEYYKPKYSLTEVYKEKIAYRIDFALIIVLFCMIALIFV